MSKPPQVLLAGRLLPAAEAGISINDRGFLYGDGLFETMRVCGGRVPFWREHLERLTDGSALLRIRLPATTEALRQDAARLIEANVLEDGLLRLQLTRGAGARGYSPRGASRPTLLLTTHALPPADPPASAWTAIISAQVVWSRSPLNRVKHTSKLVHVLARAEADDRQAHEALLLNERGEVVEASAANLFWVSSGCLLTPPLRSGALPGITRRMVIRAANQCGMPVAETECTQGTLRVADGLFLTNSARGLVELDHLNGELLARSDLVKVLRAAWEAQLAS